MITNNVDLYNYMRDKGVWTTLLLSPSDKWDTDELAIIFPETHNSTVCGNRFNKEKIEEYKKECKNIIDWMKCSSRVIVVTPVIKFDSEYMKENAPKEYELLQQINYKKQIIHTKDIGSLLVPHRLQIRYVGVEPINFDKDNHHRFIDSTYFWFSNTSKGYKKQQTHYLNVINATHDKEERRKLRYIPEYALFSQLYNKLFI